MAWTKENDRLIFTSEPPAPLPDLSAQRAEFDAACAKFREVCAAIGTLIGNPGFTGGFDEMAEFESSEAANTAAGIALSIKWMAADKLCTYLASKLGIGQPDWWYQCWESIIDEEAVVEEADDAKLMELEL